MAAVPRYTEQIVGLVTPDMRERIDNLAIRHELSVATIVRQIVHEGLPAVENWDGTEPMRYLSR